MSRWDGPAGKGAMKKVRMDKRREAEYRKYDKAIEDQEKFYTSEKTQKLLRDVFQLPSLNDYKHNAE